MAWECAECNVKESAGRRVDAICHHCGKPLCRDDRIEIADNAFSNAGAAGPTAIHCRACRRKHHPSTVRLSAAER